MTTARKISIVGLVIAFIVLLALNAHSEKITDRSVSTDQQERQKQLSVYSVPLPQGWQEVVIQDDGALYKAEKTTTDKVTSTIVIVFTPYEGLDSTGYADGLVRGSQRTLPSLRYLSVSSSSDSAAYVRKLEGYYVAENTPVSVIQVMVITNGLAYTVTGSYDPSASYTTREEVKTIAKALSQKILLVK